MKHLVWAVVLLSTILLMGCDDPAKVYEENQDIPAQVWNKDSRFEFSFDIVDTSQYYIILANLRHTTFYPNSNLWLMAYTTYPDGTKQEQRLELTLADEQGQWHGACTGDICNLQQFIQKKAYFEQPGTYTIAFEQIMRTDDLKDVLAIGLRVEKGGPLGPTDRYTQAPADSTVTTKTDSPQTVIDTIGMPKDSTR